MKGLTKEELKTFNKEEHSIICKECGTEKAVKYFTGKFSKINNKFYFNYTCNNCLYKRKLIKYGNRLDLYCATQRDKELNSLEGRALLLRNRCKQRAKLYGHTFNLTKQLIIDKLKAGVCEATGIQLDFSTMDYNPYSPSIDRIDSKKGYTDDNIQVTCLIYNFCKNKFTEEQVKNFFKLINGKI